MKNKIILVTLLTLNIQLYSSYSSSADIKTIAPKGIKTPLIAAVFNGDVKTVKELLEKNVDVNEADAHGDTALHHAVAHTTDEDPSLEIVKLLLESPRIDLTKENRDGFTPLSLAIDNNPDAVRLILAKARELKKSDPSVLEKIFTTRIVKNKKEFFKNIENHAKKAQDLELLQDLLMFENRYGETPLARAVKLGKEDIVNLLIDNGVSMDISIDFDKEYIYFRSIRKLLEKLPRTAFQRLRQAIEDQEALVEAAQENKINIVSEILNKDVTPNAQDKNGKTALSRAASAPITKLLIEAGADVNKSDFDGVTPLMIAIEKNKRNTNSAMIDLLLQAGARMNVADFDSARTPLMEAARNHDVSLVKKLVNAKVDVNAKDHEGATAMHHVIDAQEMGGGGFSNVIATHKTSAIIDILKAAGADINAQNPEGITPLMLASERKKDKAHHFVIILLNRGADPFIKNKKGQTAYDIALQNPSSEKEPILNALGKAMGIEG